MTATEDIYEQINFSNAILSTQTGMQLSNGPNGLSF